MNNSITALLNRLVETLRKDQASFRSAAAEVQGTNLKASLSSYSEQRCRFMGELEILLISLGSSFSEANQSSAIKALSLRWSDLGQAIQSRDDSAILAAAEWGEKAAIIEYQKALCHPNLPFRVFDKLNNQLTAVESAYHQIARLRQSEPGPEVLLLTTVIVAASASGTVKRRSSPRAKSRRQESGRRVFIGSWREARPGKPQMVSR
jgi:uncharacterized protein (TIGR02284 family)